MINGQAARLTDTRRREAARHLDEAMTALRHAADAGYRMVKNYTDAAALEPLRSRADFQDLIRDLTFPAQPFAE